MRFDYISPKEMSIVITPLRLYIVSAGKTNTFSLESQKGLSDLAAVMEACIGGDIKSIPAGYSVSYSFREKRHRLEITPNRVNTQSPYLKIEMVINPSNFSLEQLTLWERSKDYTIYRFSGAILILARKCSVITFSKESEGLTAPIFIRIPSVPIEFV
jgi:outer membrane lipoprotein-sorting protein